MNRVQVPWPGLVLAFVGAIVLIWVTGDFALSLALLLVWAASLFLSPKPPETVVPSPSRNPADREYIGDFLEPLGLPYLVMESGRITVANRAARELLGRHVVGQDARVSLRHPEAIRLIDRPDGGEAVVRGLTGPRSIWQVTHRPIGEHRSMIELVNRTIEADISRAHTDFVANASHELRTPLASIIGYVETLIEAGEADTMPPETRMKFLNTMARESKRLQALVEDLMSLSRIEAEKHELPAGTFDLAKATESTVAEVRSLNGKDRIELHREDGPMRVRGDEAQVNQLLRNLIDNAMKYGDPDAPVEVSLESVETGFSLRVVDRGDGIASEHLPHLTRRFYRTDPGRSRAVGGTGLGLAIVKHIVERHRGQLDIASKQGEGTTVSIRLPRHEGEDAEEAKPVARRGKMGTARAK